MWIKYNPNPTGRSVGDCAVRAVSKALDIDWEDAYTLIANNGYAMGDMPSSDSVWGAVLRQNGFYRKAMPNTCIKLAAFYTIRQHMFPESAPNLPQYSYSEPMGADYIDYDSGTEFSGLINGRRVTDILPIIDDLMGTISVVNPKLYASVIRELS